MLTLEQKAILLDIKRFSLSDAIEFLKKAKNNSYILGEQNDIDFIIRDIQNLLENDPDDEGDE